MQPVYIVCGVSGSGKSWVCRQLMDKFAYVPRDQYFNTHARVVLQTARVAQKPVITECPFGERVLKEDLEKWGVKVNPYFIVERVEVVRARYEAREKKKIPKAALTRAETILNRVHEWNAPFGTSEQIFQKLGELDL